MDPGIAKADASERSSQPIPVMSIQKWIVKKKYYSICLLASASSRSFATRGRYWTVVRRAHNENMSATGLLPWYAGRRMGFKGRGTRSVYLFVHKNFIRA